MRFIHAAVRAQVYPVTIMHIAVLTHRLVLRPSYSVVQTPSTILHLAVLIWGYAATSVGMCTACAALTDSPAGTGDRTGSGPKQIDLKILLFFALFCCAFAARRFVLMPSVCCVFVALYFWYTLLVLTGSRAHTGVSATEGTLETLVLNPLCYPTDLLRAVRY